MKEFFKYVAATVVGIIIFLIVAGIFGMMSIVGMIAGIFFGLMFGLGGLGSAFFGWLADKTSIEYIFQVSSLLPLLGIIAGFLPNTQKTKNIVAKDTGKKG